MEGIKTGVAFLDGKLGGFHCAKPYLAFGASGSGKSILGLQFACGGLGEGESVLYVCREKADDLVAQAERLGLPLEPHLDDERLVLLEYDHDFDEIVARSGPEAVLAELTGQTDPARVRRVVLDPVDPFFSTLDQEGLLRSQLRALTGELERLRWTPLLLCDDTVAARHPFVLRVFAEVCWGVFELRRPEPGSDAAHALLVYKLRSASLERSRFEFRIGEGGIRGVGETDPARRPSFARFRRAAREAPAAPVRAAGPATVPLARDPVPDPGSEGDLELLGDDDLAALEAAAGRRAGRSAPPAERPLALVVDPDARSRRALADGLAASFAVAQAADGLEALRLLAERRPALLVAASAAGRLSASALTRLLREHGADLPVLVVTPPQARAGERARALLAGADESLGEPLEPGELEARARELLGLRTPRSWPRIDPAAALRTLGPRRVEAAGLEAALASLAARAREAGIPLSLLGYEFRFVSGEDPSRFVDHFLEGLADHIRSEDLLCRHSARRIVAALVDADCDGARAVVRRVHERMAAVADAFAGRVPVKPKALFRLLVLQPERLPGEEPGARLVESLFEQPARVIEEDLGDRPGEPMEKYPLLEAVFGALTNGARECLSPLDGTRHAVEEGAGSGIRRVAIGAFRYRSQDPREESPEGFRAARGARIVWVEAGGRPVARIEDGRVFRGREA
jgi:KaiC/GvpD/RAD55 family RecA-like ATPase/DNA-binding response OmpR family regulator